MSSATLSPPPSHTDFDVAISLSTRSPTTAVFAPTAVVLEDDEDEELSDETVARLLRDAEDRMRDAASPSTSALAFAGKNASVASIKLPKLNPGSLPKPPIASTSGVYRISDRLVLVSEEERKLANSARPMATTKVSKNEPPPTAGSKWYDMPRTQQTAEFKRDFALIKHRNVLDPHRHYRKDNSGIPEYSQMGTIIEGNTEFFNSRINKKDRKKTILDEVLADGSSKQRFKRKYDDIQAGKKSGKKDFYKKIKAQRKSSK